MLPWGETHTGVFLLFNPVVELNSLTLVIGIAGSATTHVDSGVSVDCVVTAGETTTTVIGVAYYFNGNIIRSKI